MVTDKNKKQFERWLKEVENTSLNDHNELEFNQQIGVYLSYYDSLEVCINAMSYEKGNYWIGNCN